MDGVTSSALLHLRQDMREARTAGTLTTFLQTRSVRSMLAGLAQFSAEQRRMRMTLPTRTSGWADCDYIDDALLEMASIAEACTKDTRRLFWSAVEEGEVQAKKNCLEIGK